MIFKFITIITLSLLYIVNITASSSIYKPHKYRTAKISASPFIKNPLTNKLSNLALIRGGTIDTTADNVDNSDDILANMNDCETTECKEQKTSISGPTFPLSLTASSPGGKSSLPSWLSSNRSLLFSTLLPKHGAVLLRGFSVPDAAAFSEAVLSMELEEQPYIGGNAVRSVVAERVFTSNESPPTERIPFHHEMAQVPRFPTRVMFYCETPSASGGQTPIVLSNEVSDYLELEMPDLFSRFKREGVRYVRTMPKEDDATSALGRGWMSTYTGGKDDRAVCEQEMRKDGVKWEWMENGDLKTVSKKLSAVREVDGRSVFFNQVVAAYSGWNDSRNVAEKAVVFGDSMEQLPKDQMTKLIGKMETLSVSFDWEQGDVLIIDNRLAMHSRAPFVKPRRVLASLAR